MSNRVLEWRLTSPWNYHIVFIGVVDLSLLNRVLELHWAYILTHRLETFALFWILLTRVPSLGFILVLGQSFGLGHTPLGYFISLGLGKAESAGPSLPLFSRLILVLGCYFRHEFCYLLVFVVSICAWCRLCHLVQNHS